MTKSKQTTTSFEEISQTQDVIGGGTPLSLSKVIESKDYTEGTSNPSKNKYLESLANFFDVMKFVIPILLTISLTIGAFYLYKIREPIVRFEEKLVNVEKQLDMNSNKIEELQKLVYPILKK